MEWKDIAPKAGKGDILADMRAFYESWATRSRGAYDLIHRNILEALQLHLQDNIYDRHEASIKTFVQAMEWLNTQAEDCIDRAMRVGKKRGLELNLEFQIPDWLKLAVEVEKPDIIEDMNILFSGWAEDGIGEQQVYEGVFQAMNDHLVKCISTQHQGQINAYIEAMDWVAFYADACSKAQQQVRAKALKEIMN